MLRQPFVTSKVLASVTEKEPSGVVSDHRIMDLTHTRVVETGGFMECIDVDVGTKNYDVL